ncbi:MAG: LysR family transcriptional regulator [Pseudomonadota bacterium]
MDIKQRELGLLLALDALLEKQSVSAAAEQLGISQPAMSSQLRRLRDLFKDPLLTPSGRHLVVTSRALALKEDLRKHLQSLDTLVRSNRTFDPSTSRLTFRLVATDYAHSILGPALAGLLASHAPNCRLAYLPFEPKTLWQRMVADDVDLAFATGMNLQEAKMRPGIEESFCVILRKDHPLAGKQMTLERFCSAEHILVSPEGGGFVGMTDRILGEMGLRRKVAVSLPSFLMAPHLVAQSDYLCLLPRRLAKLYKNEIDIVKPPIETATFKVDLLWHSRRQHDPSHIWFRDQVAQILPTL